MAQFDVHRNPGRHRDSIPFATENLGEWVDSLAGEGDKIIAALDELLTRWR